jgi:hypothetical protein
MWYSDAQAFLVAKPDVANAVAAIGSAVLAGAAVVLSLVSLYVSHAALKHQREHNRLSVRPLAYVMFGDYENHLFVKLRNHGTGPMIVKSIRIVGAEEPLQPLVNAMPDLPSKVSWTNFVEECDGRSIPVGGELALLDLSSESSSSQPQFIAFRDKVRLALGRLAVHAEYTDIYGTNLPVSSRELKFFHRMLGQQSLEAET